MSENVSAHIDKLIKASDQCKDYAELIINTAEETLGDYEVLSKSYEGEDFDNLRAAMTKQIQGPIADTSYTLNQMGDAFALGGEQAGVCRTYAEHFIDAIEGGENNANGKCEYTSGDMLCNNLRINCVIEKIDEIDIHEDRISLDINYIGDLLSNLEISTYSPSADIEKVNAACEKVKRLDVYAENLRSYMRMVRTFDSELTANLKVAYDNLKNITKNGDIDPKKLPSSSFGKVIDQIEKSEDEYSKQLAKYGRSVLDAWNGYVPESIINADNLNSKTVKKFYESDFLRLIGYCVTPEDIKLFTALCEGDYAAVFSVDTEGLSYQMSRVLIEYEDHLVRINTWGEMTEGKDTLIEFNNALLATPGNQRSQYIRKLYDGADMMYEQYNMGYKENFTNGQAYQYKNCIARYMQLKRLADMENALVTKNKQSYSINSLTTSENGEICLGLVSEKGVSSSQTSDACAFKDLAHLDEYLAKRGLNREEYYCELLDSLMYMDVFDDRKEDGYSGDAFRKWVDYQNQLGKEITVKSMLEHLAQGGAHSYTNSYFYKDTSHYRAYQIAIDAIRMEPEFGKFKIEKMSRMDPKYNKGTNGMLFSYGNTDYVVYRGTSDGEWIDDERRFNVTPEEPMTKQMKELTNFFEEAGKDRDWNTDVRRLIVSGHSQGGNDAQTATLMTKSGAYVDAVYSFDGEGMSPGILDYLKTSPSEYFENDTYEDRINKMYAICGDDDPVNRLGEQAIPENHKKYIDLQSSRIVEAHDIVSMNEYVDSYDKANYGGMINSTFTASGEPVGTSMTPKVASNLWNVTNMLPARTREHVEDGLLQAVEAVQGEKKLGINNPDIKSVISVAVNEGIDKVECAGTTDFGVTKEYLGDIVKYATLGTVMDELGVPENVKDTIIAAELYKNNPELILEKCEEVIEEGTKEAIQKVK